MERKWRTLDVMERIAHRHGKTIPNVAMAWVLQSGMCDVALLGASNIEQFKGNMEFMSLRLTEDEVLELKAVSEQVHPYPMNFWDLFCYRDSEFYGGLG